MNPASQLGKMAAGVPKKYSSEEIAKRTKRIKAAQKERAEAMSRLKYVAESPPPEYGGFHPELVITAKKAIRVIKKLSQTQRALRRSNDQAHPTAAGGTGGAQKGQSK